MGEIKPLDEPVAKLPLAAVLGEALVIPACLLSTYIRSLSAVDVLPTALPDFTSSFPKSCFVDLFTDAADAPRLEEGFNCQPKKFYT